MSTKPRHTTVKTRHGADVRRRQRDDRARQADTDMQRDLLVYARPELS